MEEKRAKENCQIEKDDFNTILNEMEQIAITIDYDEIFFKKDEIKLEESYNYTAFKTDIKRYIEKLENAKKAIEKEEFIGNECENATKDLDMEKLEKLKLDIETNKLRNQLEETKELFIENMYKWEKENQVLKLEVEELTEISNIIQNYGENQEFDDALGVLRKPYERKNEELLKEKAILNSNIENIINQIEEKNNELEEWENYKEPEPARSKQVIKNRERLKQQNIPFIEFYNAVDFKKELTEEEKGKIESALLDMGILDSLIIPQEYREKITKLDFNFVDKYIFENPVEFKHDLTNLLDVKLPQNCNIKQELIYNVLKSIMIEEKSSTYINENGEYKIGVLEGIADSNEKAKFIGSEARRQFKQNKIKEIEEQIEELIIRKNQVNEEIQKLDSRLQLLKNEYDGFPNKTDMEIAYSQLKVNINKIVAIIDNIKRLEDILVKKLEDLKQAKEQTKIWTKNLRFALKVETYELVIDDANIIKDQIFEMERHHNNYINEAGKLNAINETLETLTGDLDDILYEVGKLNIKKQTLEAKLKVIEQMSQGMDELEQEIKIIAQRLKDIPEEKSKIDTDIGRLGSEIENLKKQEEDLNIKSDSLEKQVQILRDIVKQELELKYVISQYDELEKTINFINSEFSYFDKENKSREDYNMKLVDKYRDNNENLRDYNLNIGQMFIREIDENEEFLELEKTRTRSDISCFINGRKVGLNNLKTYIEESIEETSNLVADEDRTLFEEILIGAVGRKIRERIYFAKNWVESMNKLMKSLNTSSGLSFSINWKPKIATTEEEMDTKKIVEILNSDSALLRQEEINQVATHFRAKFKKAEKEFQEKGETVPFYSIIKDALDYRKWFEFQFMHKKFDEQSKELTNNAFYKLSGGEKAMAMYIPLFASVCARYQSAKKDCARIISLDEAFAGVDDNNIRDMFRILTELELEYIINSQVLWGEYDTVPALSICELISDVNLKVVSVMRYYWDGNKRIYNG